MSDDARPLIDNPYRASHTPIIAGDVNVTDLMARAWDRGFAAGDERLRSDFQSAASPDERLREAVAALPQYVITIQDREGYTFERGCEGQPMNYTGVMLADVEALLVAVPDPETDT